MAESRKETLVVFLSFAECAHCHHGVAPVALQSSSPLRPLISEPGGDLTLEGGVSNSKDAIGNLWNPSSVPNGASNAFGEPKMYYGCFPPPRMHGSTKD